MFVVNPHALEPVNFLDRIHQRLGQLFLSQHPQDVMRIRGPIHERLARTHMVAFAHADVLAPGDQVLARFSYLGGNDHLAFAFGVFAKRHHAIDFADDREFFGFARLEQLGHPRQPTGDILGLRCLPRDLGHDISGLYSHTLSYVDMSPHGEEITRI